MGDDEDYIRFDMHVHTWHSGDSETDPRHIVRLYETRKILCLVCDHNTTAGSAAVSTEIRKIDPAVPEILAEEIMTSEGEIIGLFLTGDVPPHLSPAETVDRIHDQGGLALVPHPFCSYRISSAIRPAALDAIIGAVDIIEGYNARVLSDEDNHRALAYARFHDRPVSVGSDAHTVQELGRCFLELDFFSSPRELLATLKSARPTFCRIDPSIHAITRRVKAAKRDQQQPE